MPDTALTNQLPPRATTSTRGSRKWTTLGGRGTSSVSTTIISTPEPEMKTNGHDRTSTSLFRKASTISRTNDAPEENNAPTLKKSRSLMNVLRSKLNSPAVLRRFRSKSRESTKQSVTEISAHPTTTTTTTDDRGGEEEDIKQSNTEQTAVTTTRKSRKRDPSPMRRLANRITQLTRHHKTTSPERQKKSPSKTITNDSHDQTEKSTSALHNKDEVDHINACYDEIRAKYFTTNKRNSSTNDAQNRPLTTTSINGLVLSNEFSSKTPLLPTSDDPLLQARKQANIKLNCLLSGYTVTTSFANHEKNYGKNDIFKFNHYYDVGKRRYDYNFTSNNNRIFSSMKTRPISKSIDSFRRTNNDENEVPIKLERINIVDTEPSVQTEKHDDVPRVLPNDNDIIQPERNTLQQSTNLTQETSTVSEEDKAHTTAEEQDEEFERNFLRAVDRALGVVNKDENNLTQTNEDTAPTKADDPQLNLFQMTEQALSSLTNSALFTDDELKNEPTENKTELQPTEDSLENAAKPTEEEPLHTSIEEPVHEELPKIDIQKPTDEQLPNVIVGKSVAEELPTVDAEKPTDQDSSQIDSKQQIDEELSTVHVEQPVDEEVPKVEVEKTSDEASSKVDTEKPAVEESQKVNVEKSADEETSEVDIKKQADEEVPTVHLEQPTVEDSVKTDAEKPADEEKVPKLDLEKSTDEVSSKVDLEKQDDERLPAIEKPTDVDLSNVTFEELVGQDSSKADVDLSNVTFEELLGQDSSDAEAKSLDNEKATNDVSIAEDIQSVIDDLILQVDEFLSEDSKNGQAFLVKLDAEEKIIKGKADAFSKIVQSDDNRLTEDVRTDINAVIGEVNLLLRGKLKQFRGLCEANVTKSNSGEPIPLDSDLEGFWDITFPLMDKVKDKFAKLDARKAKQWAPIEEYDPNDVKNRPRVIDDRLKQLQPQQNKTSKIPITKTANDDLKKLIQERRKAAATHTTNQNQDIEIFVTPK